MFVMNLISPRFRDKFNGRCLTILLFLLSPISCVIQYNIFPTKNYRTMDRPDDLYFTFVHKEDKNFNFARNRNKIRMLIYNRTKTDCIHLFLRNERNKERKKKKRKKNILARFLIHPTRPSPTENNSSLPLFLPLPKNRN